MKYKTIFIYLIILVVLLVLVWKYKHSRIVLPSTLNQGNAQVIDFTKGKV